jgi:hypothetical protein
MLTANNQSFLFLTRKGTSHRIFNPRDLYLGLEFDMLQSIKFFSTRHMIRMEFGRKQIVVV